MKRFAFLALVAVLLASSVGAAKDEDLGNFSDGRATFYGNDAWSIHKGSCGLGYIFPDRATGWDVAAVSDASPEFENSCGRCYEVRCRPSVVIDGYNETIDRREGICRDPEKSVIIRATDNCPCKYDGNAYSNRRWCCHDHGLQHFDMSLWAFEKLVVQTSDYKISNIGIIGVSWRRVPCSYRPPPEKQALPLDRPTPGEAVPKDARRPEEAPWVRRGDPEGKRQGAAQKAYDHKSAQTDSRGQFDVSNFCQGGGCDLPYPDPRLGNKTAPAIMDAPPAEPQFPAPEVPRPDQPAELPMVFNIPAITQPQPPTLSGILKVYLGASDIGLALSGGEQQAQQAQQASALPAADPPPPVRIRERGAAGQADDDSAARYEPAGAAVPPVLPAPAPEPALPAPAPPPPAPLPLLPDGKEMASLANILTGKGSPPTPPPSGRPQAGEQFDYAG